MYTNFGEFDGKRIFPHVLAKENKSITLKGIAGDYRVIPIFSYGDLVHAIDRSADLRHLIPDGVVMRDTLKLAYPGRSNEPTIKNVAASGLNIAKKKFNPFEYLKLLYESYVEQLEEMNMLLDELNPDSILIIVKSGGICTYDHDFNRRHHLEYETFIQNNAKKFPRTRVVEHYQTALRFDFPGNSLDHAILYIYNRMLSKKSS